MEPEVQQAPCWGADWGSGGRKLGHPRTCAAYDPDDPDNWRDEAEDKETTDAERDDHEGVPVVDTTGDDDSDGS